MTQLSSSRTGRATRTASTALVALCLVALQLITALHFALVPHGFNAGLNGFVHVHAARAEHSAEAQLGRASRAQGAPAFVAGGVSCASDSCPIGFAGHHSVLLGGSEASALLAVVLAPAPPPSNLLLAARKRVLLSAPKTSPPA
jgi:hypothetical protein